MNRMRVAAGTLKGQEHGLGHRSAGQQEAFAQLEIVKPALFRNHTVLGRIKLGHTAPAMRIAAIRSAVKPISASTASVCCPTDGTSPIGTS